MQATKTTRLLAICFCLASGLPAAAEDEGTCWDVKEYDGINAVPAMTMQILPAENGDTVVNDAEYPPGKGPLVVVGFWEHTKGYKPESGRHPCEGEPTMKIAYPLAYGSKKCYGWKHWTREGLHPNSAKNFSCDQDGVFHYNQWTTMTCEPGGEINEEEGERKDASPTKCCQDTPSTIYSQILSGCGKKPPR